MKSSPFILCYTREVQNEQIYAPKLAYSMHLAYSEDGKRYRPLNHNSGVLFALATENPNGSLSAKCLRHPYLFRMADGAYGVVAVRTEPDGGPDVSSRGSVLLFVTEDLLQYRELGLLNLKGDREIRDVKCEYDAANGNYIVHWSDGNGNAYRNVIADLASLNGASAPEPAEPFAVGGISADIEGIVPRNAISVTPEVAERLVRKLTVPTNIRNEVPERVVAQSEAELNAIRAIAVYSDGTKAEKPVDWRATEIDWNRPGTYRIAGRIRQDRFPFPVAPHRADPCIAKWNGKFYFIATNDADGNRSLSIREADTIPELIAAEETPILNTEMYDHLKSFLWAPELHAIGGELYLFHAGSTGEFIHIQSHVMKLKKGGNPVAASDWEAPVRVVRRDGSPLFEAGITLDMTVIQWKERVYAVWAQRQLVPDDLGSWIYIAETNPGEPWKLRTDPVLLSRPEYGWANNRTFVDEGPFALITDRKIFLTIAGALVDATYCVGLLSADPEADLLDPANWIKRNYPLLTSRSVPGEYGPGHNSYVTDDDGVIWNVYHARTGIDEPRCSGLRRVHFAADGEPVLDLTEGRDVAPERAEVSMVVVVEG
ncbi:family 43 glycosylhydrolase [Cohnella sp. REN36]|uniref:family 43 glycosylhydrolase n=1 Tax=Cohnella sp. REN36 TaxID=2887347 RepID=UPI001D1485ED|nr:family 43 glycosylhydrolase [Cohnella sp. REN36]MCC3372027.1 family 43 glycosylhydrolase [Cohnella sp. REN36]